MGRTAHLVMAVLTGLFTTIVLGPGAPSLLAQYSMVQALGYLKPGRVVTNAADYSQTNR
jgi:hypothetical protein